MAHFARINENNVVQEVIVVRDEDCNGGNDEAAGQAYLASCGFEGTWLRTSYNTYGGVHYKETQTGKVPDSKPPFRGNYAGIGMVYDPDKDEFTVPTQTPTV
jgi:hypothetical protein